MAYLCRVTQLKRMKVVITFSFPIAKTLLAVLLIITQPVFSQNDSTQHLKSRKKAVLMGTGLVYTGTLLALNQLWYADYEKGELHSFDDSKEWLQMDKAGHVYSSYLGGALCYEAFRYARIEEKKALLYGGSMGFVFLSTVEIMDGYSENWGFSWSDVISNGLGAGLFISQQAIWQKQIFRMKFSYAASEYRKQNPELLGEKWNEAVIKDYNAQTIWLSGNLSDMGIDGIPEYFNLAFGYGADRMLNADGSYFQEGIKRKAERQYYFSLDIDFTKIKTKHKGLKTLFYLANFIKVPSPTMEIREGGLSKFHWLFF